MKCLKAHHRYLPVLIAVFIFTVSLSAENKPVIKTGSLEKGMAVAAKWKDNNWYLALVTDVKGDAYMITYTDKSKDTVTRDRLCPITEGPKGNIGDTVYAIWKWSDRSGKFYKGTIESINAQGPEIIWDDGAATARIPWKQVIKP